MFGNIYDPINDVRYGGFPVHVGGGYSKIHIGGDD
jgi:hypothetical protein